MARFLHLVYSETILAGTKIEMFLELAIGIFGMKISSVAIKIEVVAPHEKSYRNSTLSISRNFFETSGLYIYKKVRERVQKRSCKKS